MNSSIARWLEVPWPLEAKANLPGSRLSRLTKSFMLLTGMALFTTSTFGIVATRASGVKSLTGS
ncbi:hypothetical protein D9M68_753780 [compost metagenome]